MSAQAAETRLLYVDFLALGLEEYETLGVYSDGTRVTTVAGSVRKGYLITDLTSPETRRGKVTVTIAAGALRGSAAVVLSPPLVDTISNYVVMATVNDSVQFWSGDAFLSSKTALSVAAYRIPSVPGNSGNAATGVTVAGNDLLDVDTVANTVHGADAGFAPHNHTITGHPVTDPQHAHPQVIPSGGVQLSANVDWLIWHV